jgi:hypothetical protein
VGGRVAVGVGDDVAQPDRRMAAKHKMNKFFILISMISIHEEK